MDDVSPSEALGSQWEYIFACLPLDLSLFGEAELSINNQQQRRKSSNKTAQDSLGSAGDLLVPLPLLLKAKTIPVDVVLLLILWGRPSAVASFLRGGKFCKRVSEDLERSRTDEGSSLKKDRKQIAAGITRLFPHNSGRCERKREKSVQILFVSCSK